MRQYRRAKLLGWIGTALILALATTVPTGYFYVRWEYEKSLGRLRSSYDALEMARFIAGRGNDWRDHLDSVAFRLNQRNADSHTTGWVLRDSDGTILAQFNTAVSTLRTLLPIPDYTASSLVAPYTTPIATIEVQVSPESALGMAAWIALLTLLPSSLLVVGLYAWPMRIISRVQDRVTALTLQDSVTGLPNRVAAGNLLTSALAATRYHRGRIAVILLDLLRFRDINDLYGKDMADQLLRLVGERLSRHVQAAEQLVRMGGDEFMLLLPVVMSPEQATQAAERLAAAMAAPFTVGVERVVLTPRLGIALSTGQEDNAEILVQHAALALRTVKSENQLGISTRAWHVFNPASDAGPVMRRQMKEDLFRGLQEKQFRLVYQPQVSLQTGEITGAEALLRWDHPTRGPVPPDIFIPAAEEAELIVEIGAFVLWEACAQAAQWPGITMAVNVSPLQFQQPDFVTSIRAALSAFNLPPQRLEIEITENMLLHRTEESLGKVAQLRSLGVRIVIDDFGIGYANIGMLRRFRFNKIKIDRSFISDLVHDQQARSIVRAVVEVGKALGATISAEGVEDDVQNRLLRMEGCEEAQGYLHGRPMRPEDFTRHLGKDREAHLSSFSAA